MRIYGNSEGILRYALVGAIIALACLALTVIATRILARRLQSEVIAPLEHVGEWPTRCASERAFEKRVPAAGLPRSTASAAISTRCWPNCKAGTPG